jgi:lysophospholipase L1-like esterase
MIAAAAVLASCSLALKVHSQIGSPVAPGASNATPVNPKVEEYRKWLTEFIGLDHYRDQNMRLPAPKPGENRVVFMGDSITEGWHLAEYFPGKPYTNRGVDGNATPQMLLRFRHDVIELQPKVIVIMGGVNDISKKRGPISVEDIEGNYASMAELARLHNIRVVFSSVMPMSNYAPDPEPFLVRSPAKILELNRWLKDYTSKTGDLYLDYFSATVDQKGMLKRELSEDGLHPNDAGYRIMTLLAEEAIKRAQVGAAKSH